MSSGISVDDIRQIFFFLLVRYCADGDKLQKVLPTKLGEKSDR